jgi:putative ABC transport system substrate-binding protein
MGLTLLAVPRAVGAQQSRLYRVGVVFPGGSFAPAIVGLREGLRELGFEEGKQFILLVREASGEPKSVEGVARDLETEKVDLIYTVGTSTTLAAKRATKSVPIVFFAGGDPTTFGLVESYRKPGGRLTGVHGLFTDLSGKRLELLKEMVPGLRRVVTFYSPDNPAGPQSMKLARAAADQLGVELVERQVATVDQLRASLRALRPGVVDALCYVPDVMVNSQADLIIAGARAVKLPTMLGNKEDAFNGALASYGTSYYTFGRLGAKHVQRVLLGADPGELPVEPVDRLYFVINLKTAKTLGLRIPQSVMARADEVIE